MCEFAVAVLIGLAGMALQPHSVRACGALAPGAWTVVETWPPDGAGDVPIDAALVLRLQGWDQRGDAVEWSWVGGPDDVQIIVRGADGLEVPGVVAGFGNWSADPTMVWRGDKPLAPDATYHVRASVISTFEPPAGAGPTEIEFGFTTGPAPWSPLAFSEAPQAVAELYDAPVAICDQGVRLVGQAADTALHPPGTLGCPVGPWGCVADGHELAQRARIEVGPIEGGQDTPPYYVGLTITDDTYWQPGGETNPTNQGHAVRQGAQAFMTAGQRHTFLVDLPVLDHDYGACVQFSVIDARGRKLDWQGPCLPRTSVPSDVPTIDVEETDAGALAQEPAATAGAPDPEPGSLQDAGVDAAVLHASDEVGRPHAVACHVGAVGRGGGSLWAVLLAVAGLLLRVRTRRTRALAVATLIGATAAAGNTGLQG